MSTGGANVPEMLTRIHAIFGDRVADRMRILTESEDGWDGKDAKAMNHQSPANFVKISEIFQPERNDLCVFLDFEGCVVISWHGVNRTLVDASIGESTIEICTDEIEIKLAIDASTIAQELSKL